MPPPGSTPTAASATRIHPGPVRRMRRGRLDGLLLRKARGHRARGADPGARRVAGRTAGRSRPQPLPPRAFDAAAQAARPVVVDRPGLQRARLARAMGGPAPVPRAADRAGRPSVHPRRPALPRPLRPPRPHRGARARQGRHAVLRAAGRGRPPALVGCSGRPDPAVRLVAGRRRRWTAHHLDARAALFGPHPDRQEQDALDPG
jgi:hypothetical protein